MITHILLSLINSSEKYLNDYDSLLKYFLWRGRPAKYRTEILEYSIRRVWVACLSFNLGKKKTEVRLYCFEI